MRCHFDDLDDEIWREQCAESDKQERKSRGMTLCPNCEGQSPTSEQMYWQVADTGDPSGACGTCNNTHEVPLPQG